MPETDLPSVMAKAIARRDEARREATAWEDFIHRLGMLEGQRAGAVMPPVPGTEVPLSGPTTRPKKTEPVVADTLAASSDYMAAIGRPAGISELYNEMIRRGVAVGGKDPKRTLDARLRYSGKFKNVPGRGWWFIGRPVPETNGSAADTREVPAAAEDRL